MDGARSAQLSPIRPALGPLIGRARRGARRHPLLLAVAVVAAGGGGAAGAILSSGSAYVATRPLDAALVKSPLVGSASTRPGVVVQIGVPTIVHVVPGATFAIAVIVANRARAPITLERARALLPLHSPLRQIGTRLIAFKPSVCPPGANCPFRDPIGEPPYGAERPVPLSLAPGQEALAQLHFRFVPCWSKALRAAATVRKVTLVYRTPGDAAFSQRIRLGDSTPKLTDLPTRPTCRR